MNGNDLDFTAVEWCQVPSDLFPTGLSRKFATTILAGEKLETNNFIVQIHMAKSAHEIKVVAFTLEIHHIKQQR
jgi:hypothetical protein